ncbi:MAG: hypothetical protein ABIP71_03870 [Verrucomicrobiota bacterium]
MSERSEAFDDFLGEEVVNTQGDPIGTFSCYWEQEEGKPVLLGIDVIGIANATHLMPAKGARLDDRKSYIVVPFSKEQVAPAPCLECGCELDPAKERKVFAYYGTEAFDYTPTKVGSSELRRRLRPENSKVRTTPVHPHQS